MRTISNKTRTVAKSRSKRRRSAKPKRPVPRVRLSLKVKHSCWPSRIQLDMRAESTQLINSEVGYSGMERVGELDDVPGNMRSRSTGVDAPLPRQGEIQGKVSS